MTSATSTAIVSRVISPPRARTFVLSALLAASLPVARAAEEIVTLPPLMVEEKANPLQWRYLEVPGLQLLSVCQDSTALAIVQRHHRLEELLTVLLPDRFCATTAVPEAQILFNEETGRAHSREIISEMLKREGARAGADGVVTLPTGDDRSPRGRPPQQIRFLPNLRMWDLDATAVFMILHENSSAPTSFTFALDRVAFLIERRTPALPDWFVEGLLGLYARTALRENDIVIEPAKWLSDDESTALARDPERPRTLFPMHQLLTHRRPRIPEEASDQDQVWRAQCALFVRWAVAEKTGVRKEALWKFVDRLETEPLSEALFREHFGMGFADARDRLSDYLPQAVQARLTLDGPKTKPLPRLKFRPATDLEVARIRGRWERMEIPYVRKRYPELAENYVEQARRTLRRVYDRGERDPQLLAELGLTEIDAGNPDGAREFLEAAVHARVVRPRADLELARFRYQAVPGLADPATKLTAEQAGEILAPLHAGRLAQPPLVEIYSLMAEVWTRRAVPPTGEELAILSDGARLFPHASALVLRAIQLNKLSGQLVAAMALADTGLRHAREPAMRERFELVRQELAARKK